MIARTEPLFFMLFVRIFLALNEKLTVTYPQKTKKKTEPGYLKYVYDIINKLYKNVTTIQANVKHILRSISEWSDAPMYKRKDGNRNSCLDIINAEHQMKVRNEKIDVTKELIQRFVHENFNLFFNVQRECNERSDQELKCNHKRDIKRFNGKSSDELRHTVRVDDIYVHQNLIRF